MKRKKIYDLLYIRVNLWTYDYIRSCFDVRVRDVTSHPCRNGKERSSREDVLLTYDLYRMGEGWNELAKVGYSCYNGKAHSVSFYIRQDYYKKFKSSMKLREMAEANR
jgi:hypothetical protein